jgi:hypothetical protein
MGTFAMSALSCFGIMIMGATGGVSGGLEFAGGTGEPNEPHEIATLVQLCLIGSDPDLLKRHYVLIADIDLDPNLPDGQVFEHALIAPDIDGASDFQGNAFTGVFDGDGHAVMNLTVRGHGYLGLFGSIGRGGCVRNLRVESAVLDGSSCIGALVGSNGGVIENCSAVVSIRAGDNSEFIGGLAGVNEGSLINCRAEGSVRSGRNSRAIGGLVGSIGRGSCEKAYYPCVAGTVSGRLLNCCSTVVVTGDQASTGLGGLAGYMWEGKATGCYASGNIDKGGSNPGGLIGYAEGGEITDCYATGDVESESGGGGLVGEVWDATVSRCYAIGQVFLRKPDDYSGGLIGRRESGLVRDCFWDVETSGMQKSYGGMGLATAQMKNAEVYALNGWGKNPNWVLDGSGDYPRLSWEAGTGTIIPEPLIDWLPGSGTEQDPYVITTVDQFARIGISSVIWSKSLSLASDLDLAGTDIRMVGMRPGIDWTGNFDGNGHVIRNMSIHIHALGSCSIGLFDRISAEGRVTDLGIENAQVIGGMYSKSLGTLAGVNQGIISHCSSYGGMVAGSDDLLDHCFFLGGLVGYNEGILSFCWADGNVKEGTELGGLVGHNHQGATIIACYSAGRVLGGADTYGRVGGLAGTNSGVITRSYAAVEVYGEKDVGGLVGWHCAGTVVDSHAIGSLTGGNGSCNLGGLVGFATSGSTISRSYAIGSVAGGDDSYGIGGLVGSLNGDGTIIGSYASGSVFAGDNSEGLGGFSGVGGGSIWNSYSIGRVSGGDNCRGVGGFMGQNPGSIVSCYAVGRVAAGDHSIGTGGLIGESSEIAESPQSSFFLVGGPVNGTGIALTDMQMKQRSSFAGWDFITVWMICEGEDYPHLQWENVQCGG